MLFGFCIELNALDIHSLGTPGHSALYKMVQSSLKKKTTKISLKTCCGWVGASLLISCISYIQREEVVSSCANLGHVRKYLLANMKWLYERGSPGVQKLLWWVGESTSSVWEGCPFSVCAPLRCIVYTRNTVKYTAYTSQKFNLRLNILFLVFTLFSVWWWWISMHCGQWTMDTVL